MAFRRSLSIRSILSARTYQPSCGYIIPRHNDDREGESFCRAPSQRYYHSFLHQRPSNNSAFSQSLRGCSDLPLFPPSGLAFYRYMSSAHVDASDKTGVINDIAEVISDSTLQAGASQASIANEVAAAASDCFFPVAALQHFIGTVHSFTGFQWWASIALATVLIRLVTVPLLIKQLKDVSQLTLMRPRLEAIREDMQNKGMDPSAVVEGQKQMKDLFKEYGVSPLTPLKGMFIQGPLFICFFLAIRNMTEKVASFQTGGAFWFVDLTAPDSLYILPILTGLSFLITVECNAQEGMEGNPMAGTVKNVSRGFAVLTVPLTMSFPSGIFCYWVTSNLFSLVYGLVLKRPRVKKLLNLPEMPVPPPGSAQQPSFDLFSALKKLKSMNQNPADSADEQPKIGGHKPSQSTAVSQRLRALESQVKKRKKNKRR